MRVFYVSQIYICVVFPYTDDVGIYVLAATLMLFVFVNNDSFFLIKLKIFHFRNNFDCLSRKHVCVNCPFFFAHNCD